LLRVLESTAALPGLDPQKMATGVAEVDWLVRHILTSDIQLRCCEIIWIKKNAPGAFFLIHLSYRYS
jgi:hypothetical protein